MLYSQIKNILSFKVVMISGEVENIFLSDPNYYQTAISFESNSFFSKSLILFDTPTASLNTEIKVKSISIIMNNGDVYKFTSIEELIELILTFDIVFKVFYNNQIFLKKPYLDTNILSKKYTY